MFNLIPIYQKLSFSLVLMMVKTNKQLSYQQLLNSFIQTSHQSGLRAIAKAMVDEKFEMSHEDAKITLVDNGLLD